MAILAEAAQLIRARGVDRPHRRATGPRPRPPTRRAISRFRPPCWTARSPTSQRFGDEASPIDARLRRRGGGGRRRAARTRAARAGTPRRRRRGDRARQPAHRPHGGRRPRRRAGARGRGGLAVARLGRRATRGAGAARPRRARARRRHVDRRQPWCSISRKNSATSPAFRSPS